MKRFLFISIFSSLLLVFFASNALAHQPRMIHGSEDVVISNPEVSQAFYATLSDDEDVYSITSSEEFFLLTEVLTPVIEGKDPGVFEVKLFQGDELLFEGKTAPSDPVFYEHFAGDEYRQGPRFEERVPAGDYTIVVSGSTAKKYTLVVGSIEAFPLDEALHAAFSMPDLKMNFFEKPWYLVYWNLVGLFLTMTIVAAVILAFALRAIIIRLKTRG